MFVKFSFYSFTQFEYQLILDAPNVSSKNTSKYNTNIYSVSRNKIIYLAIPHILSANPEQTHHPLVSYLKLRMIRHGVVCWLPMQLAVGKSYNKSLGYIAVELKALGFHECSIN